MDPEKPQKTSQTNPKSTKPNTSHYFSVKPRTPQKMRKIFESVRAHTLSLQTSTGIFSPGGIDKGTRILIENLVLHPIRSEPLNILDLGAGYGPMAIWLHKKYSMDSYLEDSGPNSSSLPKIYASEINERAMWLLKRNIQQNDCKDITILKGDFRDTGVQLQESGIKFHAIYTNPPLKTGHKVLLELFQISMDLLTEDGLIQYIHKKSLGSQAFLEKVKELRPDWHYKVIKKSGGFHVIVLSPSPFQFSQEPQKGYF